MKTIIVEDSRLAREGLARMLTEYPQLELIGTADHPDTALPLIQEHKPELFFLDIHMPGSSGFDLLEQMDYSPKIIFTTAYSEHAIRSFDFNTVDYLLKPISQERLTVAVNKVSSHTDNVTNTQRQLLDPQDKIFIKDGDHCHLITLDSIRYIESCKNYVRLYFSDTSAFLKKSLNQVEERLPKRLFFRANRQFIINLNAISAIHEAIHDGYTVTMNDKVDIEISRRQASELKELLCL